MQCPRCGKEMLPNLIKNALSRREDIHVCSTCGVEEALLDHQRKPPLPREFWHDKDPYISLFRQVDRAQLMSKDEVVAFLEENGEHQPSLAQIADGYETIHGIDMIWRYPLPDDLHNGAFIVPVKEGFMWVPYDEVDEEYYEILLPEEASILDAESCAYLMEILREYTNSLLKLFAVIQQSFLNQEDRA